MHMKNLGEAINDSDGIMTGKKYLVFHGERLRVTGEDRFQANFWNMDIFSTAGQQRQVFQIHFHVIMEGIPMYLKIGERSQSIPSFIFILGNLFGKHGLETSRVGHFEHVFAFCNQYTLKLT